MSGTTKNGVGKIITYIAVLLIFVLIFGVLGFFTNGFTSDFKTFYVENNGEKILNDKENYTISTGSDYRFDVKYTFGFMQKSQKLGYHVKVVPNTAKDTDFDITVDGNTYVYSAEKDLTNGFEVEQADDYFILTAAKDMLGVLQAVYPDKEITLPQLSPQIPYFTLVISSEDYGAEIRISFNLIHSDIVLSQNKMVF